MQRPGIDTCAAPHIAKPEHERGRITMAGGSNLPDEPVFDEWHTLLLAVRTRLRDVLDRWPVPPNTPEQQAAAERSRAIALDCADALDQLHDTLIDHGHRYRRLAFDLREARAELARHGIR